ncbi:MAG: fumarylacetoacetase [Euryarchaeota archaeon]|nr:fumarylacetoacetase [Euryarchaeota archaeon]|tara:strand:- start:1238 stop:2482 length:1245 start_codon:yes stop_codon:yes gene_type:complete
MIKANNPNLKSWVNVPEGNDFPIQNLPFGIFSTSDRSARPGVAIGEYIIDLQFLSDGGYLEGLSFEKSDFNSSTLNPIINRGKAATSALRNRISELLRYDSTELVQRDEALVSMSDATMHMPIEVGDYTDCYSSEDHARNVGKMFRDPENALLPNWKHMPVAYHGRASSIVVSGTPVKRPHGQLKPADDQPPVYGPSRLLDFELEMAFITHPGKKLGESISTAEAEDYIFGMVIFNDWSARDIQKWEYIPLGPFLGKNFASSISPWVVTLDALDPYRVSGPVQDPAVLPYLEYDGDSHYDLDLEVEIVPPNGQGKIVCRSNFKHMYWNMRQQLAHHTVNGCNIRGGDMIASGTISGPEEGSFGSMLEISWKGTKPVPMPDGTERKFIQDGDTVVMRASKGLIGFGEVSGELKPA